LLAYHGVRPACPLEIGDRPAAGGRRARTPAGDPRGDGSALRHTIGLRARRTAEERSIDAAVAEYEAALTELAGERGARSWRKGS
jgi:hypothetical protein